MSSPFWLLTEYDAAVRAPTMPGLAALESLESATDADFSGWPDEGLPHPPLCACPDCAGEQSPILQPE